MRAQTKYHLQQKIRHSRRIKVRRCSGWFSPAKGCYNCQVLDVMKDGVGWYIIYQINLELSFPCAIMINWPGKRLAPLGALEGPNLYHATNETKKIVRRPERINDDNEIFNGNSFSRMRRFRSAPITRAVGAVEIMMEELLILSSSQIEVFLAKNCTQNIWHIGTSLVSGSFSALKSCSNQTIKYCPSSDVPQGIRIVNRYRS